MKMAWQENNPPMSNLQQPNWISPGQGPQGQNFGIPSAPGSSSRYSSHHCRQVQNFTRFSIDLEEPTPIHELTI